MFKETEQIDGDEMWICGVYGYPSAAVLTESENICGIMDSGVLAEYLVGGSVRLL